MWRKLYSSLIDAAFGFRLLVLRTEHSQQLDSGAKGITSAHEVGDSFFLSTSNEVQLLRKFLRRCPYWYRGHVQLAAKSLVLRDTETAYASAMSALVLRPADSCARLLLAQALLAGGHTERAKRELELLQKDHPSPRVFEELAACEIALGNISSAQAALQQIDPRDHTPDSENMLAFVRNKLKHGAG